MNQKPIAIFAALDEEIRIIRSRLSVDEQIHFKPSLITRGRYRKSQILLVRTGIGKSAMKTAVDYCLSNYHPSICINVGYAGGTTPTTSIGDLVIATSVVDAFNEHLLTTDNELAVAAQTLCKEIGLKAITGSIATVDKIISSPHEKAFIGTAHSVIALDMEGAAFVGACLSSGVPCLVVRSILDPLDVTLPDMSDTLDKSGQISMSHLAKHIIKHPKDALNFHKIGYCAMKAREALAAFIEGWTSQ
jgi:adenosylhomocysteine nucleosidase